jgi:hypothetical protein
MSATSRADTKLKKTMSVLLSLETRLAGRRFRADLAEIVQACQTLDESPNNWTKWRRRGGGRTWAIV